MHQGPRPVGYGGIKRGGVGTRWAAGRGVFGNNLAGPPRMQKNSNTLLEVEIICLSQENAKYASKVELKLKEKGLNVDILLLNPEFPLEQILGTLTTRKVLFAVLVDNGSSENRSVTVYTLQGEAQEHKNMATPEAVDYIVRNYARQVDKPQGSVVGQRPLFSVPGNVRYILEDFMADKPLSISDYDALLKFLMDRRETSLKGEHGSNIPPHLLLAPGLQDEIEPALRGKQEEIQSHVLEILNKDPNILLQQPPGSQASQDPASNQNPPAMMSGNYGANQANLQQFQNLGDMRGSMFW